MNGSVLGSISSLFSITDEQRCGACRCMTMPTPLPSWYGAGKGPSRDSAHECSAMKHRGQDLTQDTFVRLFAKRKEYQPIGRFSTFLWRIALNLCYDELRRLKRRPEASLEDESSWSRDDFENFRVVEPGPDEHLLEQEKARLSAKQSCSSRRLTGASSSCAITKT